MNVIITIDTEADNQWDASRTTTTENIKFLPRFQDLCDRYRLKPTYLCTYEVVQSQPFSALKEYQQSGRAEIGAHLHPWSNPPEENYFGDTGARPYPSELPLELFRQKLKVLTDALAARTGQRPCSYRAGRWGVAAEHISVLLELGYTVDCSVTPFFSWEKHAGQKAGGPDFRRAPVAPYFLDPYDLCREGTSPLLEVPVTILSTNRFWGGQKTLLQFLMRYRSSSTYKKLDRVFSFSPRWFRPFPSMSAQDLIEVYCAARQRRLPAVEMMFHSSELMPGGSPYNPTSDSVEDLYRKLQEVFGFVTENDGLGMTLGDFAQGFSRKKS